MFSRVSIIQHAASIDLLHTFVSIILKKNPSNELEGERLYSCCLWNCIAHRHATERSTPITNAAQRYTTI